MYIYTLMYECVEEVFYGGARGVIDTVIGNRYEDPISIPERSCRHYA